MNMTFERHPASHHDQRDEPEHERTAIQDREPPQLRELPDSRKPDVPKDVQIGQPVEALGRCSVQRGRAEDQHERRVRAHRLDPFPERSDQRLMELLAIPSRPAFEPLFGHHDPERRGEQQLADARHQDRQGEVHGRERHARDDPG